MSEIKLYHNLTLSDTTKNKRKQIKSLQDEFMTFSWGGYDAFENFGAFIINDKNGSLTFYNGPGFSNEYSKPQFDSSGGDLQGVSFNKQTISFTIGVYWISIEHYRLMLNWLNPLDTNYLIFGFNPNYRYNVKLSKLGDSIKWVVGKENGKPMYYTEIKLTFDVQGTPCAKGVNSYEFEEWQSRENDNKLIRETKLSNTFMTSTNFILSDLPTPIDISLPFMLQDNDLGESIDPIEYSKSYIYHIELSAKYTDTETNSTDILSLFSIDLKNLTISKTNPLKLNIRYNSETSLLFLTYGNSNEKILSLLNINDIGEKIIDNYSANKFFIPGQFDYPNFNYENMILELSVWKYDSSNNHKQVSNSFLAQLNEGKIICYPRTNII